MGALAGAPAALPCGACGPPCEGLAGVGVKPAPVVWGAPDSSAGSCEPCCGCWDWGGTSIAQLTSESAARPRAGVMRRCMARLVTGPRAEASLLLGRAERRDV